MSVPSSASSPEPRPQEPASSTSNIVLEVKEEAHDGGTRIRVSTPKITVLSEGDRSLRLRLECVHPTAARQTPDQCPVYLISFSSKLRYREHETPFAAEVDGARTVSAPFQSFKVVREGDAVVEPLLSIWSWHEIKTIAGGSEVTFILAGERIPVSREVIAVLNQMVHYFDK